MSAAVRKVLLRLRRKFRAGARTAEANMSAGQATTWAAAEDDVALEIEKLDKPKKRATKKAARKSR